MLMDFIKRMGEDHVSAYAAQTAYFTMLSFIPIIMLLLALMKYTPVSEAMIQKVFSENVPGAVYPMILGIIDDVYNRSTSLIPVTAIATAWSAGKGVLAMTRGFNCIYKVNETRNYIALRLRSAVYTVLLIASVVLSLSIMVFGNQLHELFRGRFPVLEQITACIISFRTLLMLGVLVLFFTFIYRFLPNRRAAILLQVPGAMFTAAAWSGFSFFFSIDVDQYSNDSRTYGSLTTLIIVMLWLYACMYIVMIGAAINSYYEGKFREMRERARRKKFIRREARRLEESEEGAKV